MSRRTAISRTTSACSRTPTPWLSKSVNGLRPSAKRKLEAIKAATRLEDLMVPPANRLEKLKGDLKDFHSIRISDQWRVIFRWIDGEARDVQIVDYH
jgi:proteic killer suppression protein